MSFTSATPSAGTAPRPGERWADVYLSATARAVSICGDFLAATALVLALQQRGAGGYAVAAILLAAALPPVVLAPLTGRLVDRLDSRLLLVTAGLAQAVVCAALAFATSTVLIIALAALLSAGLAVSQPTFSALLPAMVRRSSLPRAAALGQTANSIGSLAAPVLGGLLFGAFGLRVPLLVDAASYVAIAAVGFALRTRRNAGRPAPAASATPAVPGSVQAGPPVPSGWRLREDALLLPLIVLTAAVVAVISAANVIEVFFVRDNLHASTTAYGLVQGVWLATTMVGAWLLARLKLADAGTAGAMLAALGLLCAVFAAIAVVPNLGWLVPCYVLGGVLNGMLNTALGVLAGGRVPAAARGRAYAFLGAVTNAASAGGFVLGGVLLSVLAVRPTILLVGVAGVVVTALFAAPSLRAIARERGTARASAMPDVLPEPVGVS